MRVTIWAALLICATCASPAHSEPSAPVPVGTVTAEKRPVAKALDFVGRVEAINRVEVRARVKGYLEAVLFKEGDLVNEGAPLYRIESARRTRYGLNYWQTLRFPGRNDRNENHPVTPSKV